MQFTKFSGEFREQQSTEVYGKKSKRQGSSKNASSYCYSLKEKATSRTMQFISKRLEKSEQPEQTGFNYSVPSLHGNDIPPLDTDIDIDTRHHIYYWTSYIYQTSDSTSQQCATTHVSSMSAAILAGVEKSSHVSTKNPSTTESNPKLATP
jgi:hypothetical protein